jgi:hypothetical protein
MNTTAYRHVLVPIEDGPLLEWLRVQTGCRSLTKALSLLIRIATTPEGLAFIKNHPLCEGRERPPHPHPLTAPGPVGRSVRELMLGRDARDPRPTIHEQKVAYDSEKVGAAVAARTLNGEV